MSSKKVATILIRFGALFIFMSALSGFFEIVADESREKLSNELQKFASEINKYAEKGGDFKKDLIDTSSLEEYKSDWIKSGTVFAIILSMLSIAIFYYSDHVGAFIVHGFPKSIDSTIFSILIIQVLSFSIFVKISFLIVTMILLGRFLEFFKEAGVITVVIYIFCLLLVVFAPFVSRIFTWKIKDS